MTFSRRTNFAAPLNRLTIAREGRRRRGQEILDLTVSNPTETGIGYPLDELAEAMARGGGATRRLPVTGGAAAPAPHRSRCTYSVYKDARPPSAAS